MGDNSKQIKHSPGSDIEYFNNEFLDTWTRYEDCLVYAAVRTDNIEELCFLIDNGKIFMTNSRGQNTFHQAAQMASMTAISFILNRLNAKNINASVYFNAIDKYGRTPLDLALYLKRYDIARVFCIHFRCICSDAIRRSTVLHNSERWIRIIIEHRLLTPAELSMTFHKGFNLLHTAINAEYLDILKLLLEYGVSTRVKTLSNITPISLSHSTHREDIIYLVKYYDGSVCDVPKSRYPPSNVETRIFEK